MENKKEQITQAKPDEQFQKKLAAAMRLPKLDDFPAQLDVNEDPIPDMSRWLEHG